MGYIFFLSVRIGLVEIKKGEWIYIVNVQNGYPKSKRGSFWEVQELWSGELTMGSNGEETILIGQDKIS